MPLYDYKCENGHTFELLQSWTSERVATCGECGTDAQRQISVPMVMYKGSGFYTTDYARNGSSRNGNGSSDSESDSKSNGAKSESKSKKSDASSSSSSGSKKESASASASKSD